MSSTVQNKPQGRDPRGIYYSEKLLGVETDCNVRHCSEVETSTGLLLYDPGTNDWFIGFECCCDGLSGRRTPALKLLIDQVFQEARAAGIDLVEMAKARARARIASDPAV